MRVAMRTGLGLGVCLCLTVSGLRGQADICTIDGAAAGDRMGTAVAGAGNRAFAGAPNATVLPFPAGTGAVAARTWTRGAGCQNPFPTALPGSQAGAMFGAAMASAGAQFIIGGPTSMAPAGVNTGDVRVLAPTGIAVLSFVGVAANDYFGTAVSPAGDLDGDGIADFVVGAPMAAGRSISAFYSSCGQSITCYGGKVHAVSGSLGNPWMCTVGGGPSGWANCGGAGCWSLGVGTAVAGIGDINGDGLDDFLAGARDYGRVYTFSAAGMVCTEIRRDSGPSSFGAAVVGMGDLDGDGVDDYAGGAPGSNSVELRSGATGAVIHAFQASPPGQAFGTALANVGDQDGDGVADLLVGAPSASQPPGATSNTGAAYLYSGKHTAGQPSHHLLAVTRGASSMGRYGSAVAGIGDLTGDGLPEFMVGDPDASPAGAMAAGQAKVLSRDPNLPKRQRLGTGCAPAGTSGLVPLIGLPDGLPAVGASRFSVGVARAPASTPAVLFLGGLQQPPLNLGAVFPTLSGCMLHVTLLVAIPASTASTTLSTQAGQGFASIPLPIPNNPSLSGKTFYVQWYVIDPGPFAMPATMTEAMALTI